MSSTAKADSRNAQNSLLNLLSEIEENDCKTSVKRKVGREPIDLNAADIEKRQPQMRQQQATHDSLGGKKREKFAPTFSNVPIRTSSNYLPSRQTASHAQTETIGRRQMTATHKKESQGQFEEYIESKYPKMRQFQRPQKQFARQFPRKKYHNHHTHPIQNKTQPFPISFQQTIIYDDVAISICFGNYKMLEPQMNLQTVLVVPFSNMECNSQLIFDLEKRTETNIKRILEKQLDNRNISNYRIGEIVVFTCLQNIPYKRVYFNKTPNNEGLANFLLEKLCQNVKNLIEKAQNEGAKCIVFAEWMWSHLESYQISHMTFKAIIDGIKNIGAVKGLRSVKLFIGKKVEFQAYVKAFRQMSDQYLEAFYRE